MRGRDHGESRDGSPENTEGRGEGSREWSGDQEAHKGKS